MTEAITAEGLIKRFGKVTALDGLDLRVRTGEVHGFLGPNGAGKSTTLRVLTGFLTPTRGRALVGGYDVVSEPLSARRSLGYLPETCPLYPELRVEEYLRFRAELKHVARRHVRDRVSSAMKAAGIHDRRGALIGQLSRGLRQRVGLADALVAEPPLLILDEPTAGLDPNQIREVRQLIADLRGKHTVLLSTHILTEAEMTCDRAVVLSRGRVVADGTLSELGERQNRATVTLLRTALDEPALRELLSPVARLSRCERAHDELRCWLSLTHSDGLAPVLTRLVEAGVDVHEAALQHTNLEEVFARLTREEPNA